MLITYRRTGGGLVLLAAGLVATGITLALAVVLGMVAAAIGTVALLARTVLPSARFRRTAPPAARWPHETIDAIVVSPSGSSNGGTDVALERLP